MTSILNMNESREQPPARDWFPILAPVFLSLVFQLCGAIWLFSSINTRVASLEDRQKIIDATRVTQDDLKARNAQMMIEKQELDLRLNRMDDKLDRLVEMQIAHRSGKE